MLKRPLGSLVFPVFLLSCFLHLTLPSGNSVVKLLNPSPGLKLRLARSSNLDLELGGDLAGVPAGQSRYLTREDLLAQPQVSYTVNDDANFRKPTQISGVLLEELAKRLSGNPQSNMTVALCRDLYQANFTRAYLSAHQPILVLLVNGRPPANWPKDSESHNAYMGPYLIAHAKFVPSFHVLSLPERPQIPWGIIRLEFRDEKRNFAAIAPRGPQRNSAMVQAGYLIARQDCFRCHNQGSDGGQKAARPWAVLSAWASGSPERFAAYVRNPQSRNPNAQMPCNPNFDDTALQALISYFRTFNTQDKP
jgi:mono/diheme cytochrome c family protein